MGKPAAVQSQMSKGLDGPATESIGPYASTFTIGGRPVQLRGITSYAGHIPYSGGYHSPGAERLVKMVASKFLIEGSPIACEDDELNDGDQIAPGPNTSFIIG